MGNKDLSVQTKQQQVEYIDEKFALGETVSQLHFMMKEVTKKEITPNTVHAACNCVKQLNSTIDIAIKAAEFLSGK